MARLCELCGTNLDKFAAPGSDRHYCLGGKLAGARAATRLERERIEAGQLDSSIPLPKSQPKASEPLGRLARRPPDAAQPAPARQPQEAQPSNRDLMAAIDSLRQQFEALRSVLLSKHTDA
jgi:hypothetical protein